MLSVIKMSTPWLTNGNWKLLSVLFPFLFCIFSWFCVKWRWSKCNSWWISTSMISGLQCIYCSLNEFVVRSHKVPRYRYFGHFVNGHLICQLTFQKSCVVCVQLFVHICRWQNDSFVCTFPNPIEIRNCVSTRRRVCSWFLFWCTVFFAFSRRNRKKQVF